MSCIISVLSLQWFCVVILLFVFALNGQDIEWFKATDIHQQNIEQTINGWSECPLWNEELASSMFPQPSFDTATFNNSIYNLTALCITLQVPLNWDDQNNNKTIDYFISRILSTFDPYNTEQNGAYWVLNGGPGESGQSLYPDMIPFVKFLDHSFDFYCPDHRGSGNSNFLRCDPISFQKCVQNFNESYGDDLHYFSTYSASLDLGYAIDLFHANLSTYNNENDVIHGISYGTYHLNNYLTLFPDQLNAAIFDGIAPSDIDATSKFDHGVNEVGLLFLDRCNANPFCHQRFLDLDTTILNATRRIFDELKMYNDGIINADRHVLSCLDDIKDTDFYAMQRTFAGFLATMDYRALVPPMIYRLYRCDEKLGDESIMSLIRAVGEDYINPFVNYSSDDPQSWALSFNIVLSEEWNGVNASDPGPSYDQFVAEERGYYFSMGVSAPLRQAWDIWNRYTPNVVVQNKYANTSMPMLLLNGDLDPNTPLEAALHAASMYGASIDDATPNEKKRYFFTFPNSPHVIILHSLVKNYTDTTLELDADLKVCGMYIIQSFIDPNSGYVPNADCIGWLSDIDWNGTTNITKQIGLALLGTTDIWGVRTVDSVETTSMERTSQLLTIYPTEPSLILPSNSSSRGKAEKDWMITAIVFICAFVLSLVVICWMTMNNKRFRGKTREERTEVEMEAGTLQKTHILPDSD